MNCPNCGMKVGPADTVCRVCGVPLTSAPSEGGSGLRFGPAPRGPADPGPAVSDSGLRIGGHSGSDVSGSGLRISEHSSGPAGADGAAAAGSGTPVYVPVSDPASPYPPYSPEPVSPAPESAPRRRIRKQSPAATALVVVLALVVLAAAVYLPYRFLYLPFVQNRPLTRTALLEKYLQAVLEHDPKTAYSLTPFAKDKDLYDSFSRHVVTDDGGEAKREMKKTYGKYTVKVKIDETNVYNEELLDRVLGLFAMNYQFAGYKLSELMDTGAVAEVVQVKGTCTVSGKKGSDERPFTATIIKYDDEWKVLDSSFSERQSQIDISSLLP